MYKHIVFVVERELNRQSETTTTGYSGGYYFI